MNLTCPVNNTDKSVGVPAQPMPAVNTLRVMGSGNSGLDPAFDGGGDKTANTNRLQWFLYQVSGQRAAYVYNSTIAGSFMSARWAMPEAEGDSIGGRGRWHAADVNTLLLTDSSGATSIDPNVFASQVLDWCKLYWTSGDGGSGADVVLWSAQLRRGLASGSTVTPTDWTNFCARHMLRYETALTLVNAHRPAGRRAVRFMPLPVIMERIRLDTLAGLAPSATFFDDLYNLDVNTDTFHMGNKPLAKWLVGGAATIILTGCSPAQLPATAEDLVALDATGLLYLRRVMHDTLKAYRYTGIDTSGWVRA